MEQEAFSKCPHFHVKSNLAFQMKKQTAFTAQLIKLEMCTKKVAQQSQLALAIMIPTHSPAENVMEVVKNVQDQKKQIVLNVQVLISSFLVIDAFWSVHLDLMKTN
jgi:hypothetical protein